MLLNYEMIFKKNTFKKYGAFVQCNADAHQQCNALTLEDCVLSFATAIDGGGVAFVHCIWGMENGGITLGRVRPPSPTKWGQWPQRTQQLNASHKCKPFVTSLNRKKITCCFCFIFIHFKCSVSTTPHMSLKSTAAKANYN